MGDFRFKPRRVRKAGLPSTPYAKAVALCQRCHLHIQARYRPGQMWLFEPPSWAVKRGLSIS